MVPKTMRAVLLTGYGGLDMLEYRCDIPTPEPATGEVLLRVGACGLNNTDINLRTRWYDRAINESLSEAVALHGAAPATGIDGGAPAASWKAEATSFPRIQGAAVVGRVVAVGDGVDASCLGQRVIVDPQIRDESLPARAQLVAYLGGDRDGGFAEYVAVPADNAHPVDSPMSDAELATFPTSYDTAEEMLERGRLTAAETVLITGAAGGVGTALIQLALTRGAKVIAVAGEGKEDRLRQLGARYFVRRDVPSLKAAVENLVGKEAVDLVADVVGGPLFGDLLSVLRRGGRYTSAGAIAGPVQRLDLRDLIYKDLEMYGVTSPTRETFARIVSHITSGRLHPLLEKTYPLAEVIQGQRDLARRTHIGKFAVVP